MSLTRLSHSEELILLAILRLRHNAYATQVAGFLTETTGRATHRGAVDRVLRRLTKKGLVGPTTDAPARLRAGRGTRSYAVLPSGLDTLLERRRIRKVAWEGLGEAVRHSVPDADNVLGRDRGSRLRPPGIRFLAEIQDLCDDQRRALTAVFKLLDQLREPGAGGKHGLDLIVHGAREITAAEGAQVLLRVGDQLEIAASFPEVRLGDSLDMDKCASGYCLETGRPVLTGNVELDPLLHRRFVPILRESLGGSTLSELAVPLFIGDQPAGVLNVESPRQDAFSEHHMELLDWYSSQAIAVLARRSLVSSEQVFAAVAESAEGEPISIWVDAFLDGIVDVIQDYLGTCRYYHLLVPVENDLRVVHSTSTDVIGVTVPMNSVSGQAFRHRSIEVVPNVGEVPDYAPIHFGSLSEAAIPIVVGGDAVAVLSLERDVANSFTRSSRTIVEHLIKDHAWLIAMAGETYDRESRNADDVAHIIEEDETNLREFATAMISI